MIKILDAKWGITEGGMACGPIDGSVIVSINYDDGNGAKWLSLAEVVGIPCFYESKEDIFQKLMDEDVDDEEFVRALNEDYYLKSFHDIELGEYDDMFESLNEDGEYAKLLRLIVHICRDETEITEKLVESCKGKTIDEIEVPFLQEEDY